MTTIGILGNGFMGNKYLKAIEKIGEAKVSTIIDASTDPHQNQNISYYLSLEDFLNKKPEVDLVVIATPNHLHYAQAYALLANGYSVMIEKPYAFKGSEMKTLFEVAHQHQVWLYFSAPNRFSPISKWLKNICENNILGTPFLININCFWNRDERYYQPNSWKGKKAEDGGILYTQFFHFLDLMCWLFGRVKLKYATAKTLKNKVEIEDTLSIIFDLNDGGTANLNLTTAVWDKNMESTMSIIAEKGSLKIGGQYFDDIQHCHIQNFSFDKHQIPTATTSNLAQNIQYIIQQMKSSSDDSTSYYIDLIGCIEEVYQMATS